MARACWILCFVMFTGCASTKHLLLDPSLKLVPFAPEEVRVILNKQELEQYEYVEIATMEASKTFASYYTLVEMLRKKAGELGANAILWPSLYGTKLSPQSSAIAVLIMRRKQ